MSTYCETIYPKLYTLTQIIFRELMSQKIMHNITQHIFRFLRNIVNDAYHKQDFWVRHFFLINYKPKIIIRKVDF